IETTAGAVDPNRDVITRVVTSPIGIERISNLRVLSIPEGEGLGFGQLESLAPSPSIGVVGTLPRLGRWLPL
ncbi:hypothetical protein CRG98_024343, partial [Punica granatum]